MYTGNVYTITELLVQSKLYVDKMYVIIFAGRILNRFSKDLGFVDDVMSFTCCDFLQVNASGNATLSSLA